MTERWMPRDDDRFLRGVDQSGEKKKNKKPGVERVLLSSSFLTTYLFFFFLFSHDEAYDKTVLIKTGFLIFLHA